MRPFLSSSVRPGTVVDSMYSLPLSGLGKEEIEDEKTKLTLQPKSTFGPCVSSFCVYRIDSERLYVPREYGIQRFGKAETDQRVEGDRVVFTFGTELRPVQTRALSALDRHLPVDGPGGAIVVLPCGMGKTVLAIAFAASRA